MFGLIKRSVLQNMRMASTLAARPAGAMHAAAGAFFPVSRLSQSFSQLQHQQITFIEPPAAAPVEELSLTSVLRKRRLKMKKHKLRKRRKAQRAERIKHKK